MPPLRVGVRRARAPNRHLPDVRVDKAQKAWDAGRHDEAIWYYERALARDPNNPVLLADVARAYALRYRYADAEKLVERAESLHSKDAHLQEMLGRSFVQIQQFDRAIACYRRSLELAPSSPERPQILLELAKMHERLHDLASARTCVEESLALTPNLEAARYMLANIERRDGNIEIAEKLWREIIATKKATLRVTADSWYQLAAIHDKAGQYEEAFQDLTQAKKIFMRGAAHYFDDAWTIARNAGKTFAAITPERLDCWSTASRDLEPFGGRLALLTSHPRSGTTLLEQVLDSHPGAISADELQVMVELVNSPLGRTAGPNESAPSVFDRTSLEDLNRLRRDYWAGNRGCIAATHRRPAAGGQESRDDVPAAAGGASISGNEDRIRVAGSARRGGELLHAATAAQRDQRQLPVVGRHGEEICGQHARLVEDSRDAAESVDRDPVRRHGCGFRRPIAESTRFSRAAVGRAGVGISPSRTTQARPLANL